MNKMIKRILFVWFATAMPLMASDGAAGAGRGDAHGPAEAEERVARGAPPAPTAALQALPSRVVIIQEDGVRTLNSDGEIGDPMPASYVCRTFVGPPLLVCSALSQRPSPVPEDAPGVLGKLYSQRAYVSGLILTAEEGLDTFDTTRLGPAVLGASSLHLLELRGPGWTAAPMATLLAQLKTSSVQRVVFTAVRFGEEEVRAVSGPLRVLPGLQYVGFEDCDIIEAALPGLARFLPQLGHLRYLSLRGSFGEGEPRRDITPVVAATGGCALLRVLDMRRTHFNAEDAAELSRGLPLHLDTLDLRLNPGLTGAGYLEVFRAGAARGEEDEDTNPTIRADPEVMRQYVELLEPGAGKGLGGSDAGLMPE